MPIYEFRCHKCNQRFEKLCSMGENGENIKCPACGKPGPQRVMSGFSAKGVDGGGPVVGGGGCNTCSSTNCGSCGQ